jgi:glycosyltransferase involved in cell wall biosynthesis
MRRIPVLYISYDGALEPLGQSQVLAYLVAIAREGRHEITLMSFEKRADWADHKRRAATAARLREAGIRWVPLRYHKRPTVPATAFDVATGIVVGSWLCFWRGVRVVHARSYVAGVIALWLKRLTRARFLFDMRGFWADERVDAGLWRKTSALYRAAKSFERRLLLSSDAVVSLTRAAVDVMRGFPYLAGRSQRFEVIPTCADLERFRPHSRPASARFTVGYVGTASGWYVFEPVATCFKAILSREPGARLVVLNRSEHELVRRALAAKGIGPEAYEIRAVSHEEIAREMSRLDAGIFFIKPTFSKIASMPTKLAEFLGCGVPCLTNSGVGDVDRALAGGGAGVLIDDYGDEKELARGTAELMRLASDPETRQRCVETARRHFSLADGALNYARLYDSLAKTGARSPATETPSSSTIDARS